MNMIQAALRNPITVLVAISGIMFFSVLAAFKIPIDIFPALDFPTIYVAQPYGGMAPDKMDGLIAARYQDQFLYVSGIKEIEVKSIQGLSLIKLSFYAGTDMGQAAAEVANQVTRAQSYMPQGTVPPQVVRFDASSIPVGQLVFESDSKSLNEIQDAAASRIRPMFSNIPGVSAPPPFGGNQRSIVVRVDPEKMLSYELTPEEIVKAIADNNQPSAAGNIRVGDKVAMTPMNSFINKPEEFLTIPIRIGKGPAVYIRDIATVEDAADITVGYAIINGKRAVYIPVVKKAEASTVQVVKNVKEAIPKLQNAISADIHLSYEFDQSVYVVNALESVLSEGVIGALLTGLMVLLFLNDWRSAVIVVINIPVSLAAALLMLKLCGQTLNIMTLSGMALAIGILVDESTVTIENIHQHLEMGKNKARAILDACLEIAFPKLLILLCILVVFAPAFIMSGIPKSMFLPLSLAVGFSMIASFLLSQTFVPVISNWLLKSTHAHSTDQHIDHGMAMDAVEVDQIENEIDNPNKPVKGFEKFKLKYTDFIERNMKRKNLIIGFYLFGCAVTIFAGFKLIGTDVLPRTNNKQFQLRMAAPDGTRIETTEKYYEKLLGIIEDIIGKDNIEITSSYVGTQPSSYGSSPIFVFTSGPQEAVMQIAIKEETEINMQAFQEKLRAQVADKMPDTEITFEPIELTEKIMSQGASTPIQVEVASKNIMEAKYFAEKIMQQMKGIHYLRDIKIIQPLDYPTYDITVDRVLAGKNDITPKEILKSMVSATSSSRFIEKNLWMDPKNGLAYQVQVQIPEYDMKSEQDMMSIPLRSGENRVLLSNVATISPNSVPGEIDRKGPNKLVTISASIYDQDLGKAGQDVANAIKIVGKPPRGIVVNLKGLVPLLDDTLSSLQVGLLIAIVVIFLLLSANFQSFSMSLVVLSTIPAVIAGSIWMLLLTGSTLNLQSYMGLIMSVGVSVANALLMITNAESIRLDIGDATKASVLAASTRIRPILMTSIAMIVGMIPMASGMGEGGDQVAPLGRAVIGGLFASTIVALTVLPMVFASIQNKASLTSVSLDPEDDKSVFYEPTIQAKHSH
jgi:multidrug efflux pump subunit AcrB